MTADPIRFVDVLTTASSIASYLGASEVTAAHLLDALRVLHGEVALEDLGPGMPPIIPRPPGGPTVRDDVKALAREWVTRLNEDITATLTEAQITSLIPELEMLSNGDIERP